MWILQSPSKAICIPAGEAPLHIRKKWIGCGELPVSAIHNNGGITGVLTGKQSRDHDGIVYSVDQEEAIEILSQTYPEAAAWWNDHGYPKKDQNFCFRQDEIEEVGQFEEIIPQVKVFFGTLEEGVGAEDNLRNTAGGQN